MTLLCKRIKFYYEPREEHNYVNIVLTDTLYNIDILEDEIYPNLYCVTYFSYKLYG